MGLLSPILRNGTDGRLTWWCPGCNHAHMIQTGDGPSPRWGWNGNAERPTFTPSVLVRWGSYADPNWKPEPGFQFPATVLMFRAAATASWSTARCRC